MEGSSANDAPTDGASSALDTSTAKRRAVHARKSSRRRRRGRPLLTSGLLTLVAVLMVASASVSLIASDWQTFSPFNGIGVFGQLPLEPQGFGDSAVMNQGAAPSVATSVAGISGQTHKPTVPPTATIGSGGHKGSSGSGGSGGSSSYGASYSGSWTGGVGQGCPGGAPTPKTYVVYNAATYGRPRTNMVALTFDDGPTPFTTPPILTFLEQTHTPATFFVMGQYAQAYPWLVQREAADGFAIGVHTWNHPDMELLSPAARAWQLGSTIQQLHNDLGPGFCAWLWRPPYGAVNSGIVQQADGFGLTTINWDVDPMDWSRPGTMVIVQRVLSQVRPGSIILLHDGPAAREQTAAALPYILAGLQARGLIPVTLPTLLGSNSAATGPLVTPTATVTVGPTATATASPTAAPSPTATTPAPTPTDTPVPPTPTNTPVGGFGGGLVTAYGASPYALSLWLWQNSYTGE